MIVLVDDDFWFDVGVQCMGVVQQLEDVVGEVLGIVQVDVLVVQFVLGIDDVVQGVEQYFVSIGDYFVIDEGVGWCVDQFQVYVVVLLVDMYFEVFVGVEDGFGVVVVGVGIEDCQGVLVEQLVGFVVGGFVQLLYFVLGEGFQCVFWID